MNRELHTKLTLHLYTEDRQRSFGPGMATLLERVQEHKSLRSAAASMEMAYSKAWRIIHAAEEIFGCKLLSSTIGGRHGGGTVLTPEAEQLLTAYRAYEHSLCSYADATFKEHFDFYQALKKQ